MRRNRYPFMMRNRFGLTFAQTKAHNSKMVREHGNAIDVLEADGAFLAVPKTGLRKVLFNVWEWIKQFLIRTPLVLLIALVRYFLKKLERSWLYRKEIRSMPSRMWPSNRFQVWAVGSI